MKDIKFHEGDIKSLYLNTYTFRKDLKTLRDLDDSHLELLESMYHDGIQAISDKYGVKKNQIVVFLHYIPTYYHLHVHYCHQKWVEGFSANIGR